ncbi:hypothetical protein IGI04_036108 [Brassica rapa subsp. trilocularis]|uniref:Uncharacterized protein n=1 Tax=Brassica rapa subsp. trilocularis TaxID=1813537 RepID=A0ABQ7LDP8_BRACM|nr:hypothetical protein IGI04_036108 [Brassica rapa subsp. trilocularis]
MSHSSSNGTNDRCCPHPPSLNLQVDEGIEEPVSYPDLVRKTLTRKDGTFIDEQAAALVLEVEKARGQTRMVTIYGLSNLQYKNKHPSGSVPAALKQNIDMEMRVSGLETLTQEIKSDVHALKTYFNEGTSKT